MRFKEIFFLLPILIISGVTDGQDKKKMQVENAVKALHEAMVNADSAGMYSLTAGTLNYVHSGGDVDDQQSFVRKITSGRSDFVAIVTGQQVITVSKKTAIVRHILKADTNDNGMPGKVQLRIMQVWQKLSGKWRLIGRAATRIT